MYTAALLCDHTKLICLVQAIHLTRYLSSGHKIIYYILSDFKETLQCLIDSEPTMYITLIKVIVCRNYPTHNNYNHVG